MSKLNQAFIKAYGKPDAGRAHSAVQAAEQSPRAAQHVRGTDGVGPAAPASTARQYAYHEAHDAVPAPHTRESAARGVHLAASAVHAPHFAIGGASRAQPLPLHGAATAPQPNLLAPAFEVPRFAWPRIIELLIAAAGSEFAQLTDELLATRGQRKVLAISGSHRGEGRTTLLVALARLLCNRGWKLALVDADFNSPQLAERLGVVPAVGWDDVFAGEQALAEALVESVDDCATLLPLRSPIADLSSLAGNPRLPLTLRSLRDQYDLVLVDLGPLVDDAIGVDLAAALGGSKIDSAIVVRDMRRTNDRQLRSLNRRLAALGIQHWEIAENFQRIAAAAA